jgi:hypothetical protein
MDMDYQMKLFIEASKGMKEIYSGNVIVDGNSMIVRFFLDSEGWVYGSYGFKKPKKLFNTFNDPDIEVLKKSLVQIYGAKLANTSIFFRSGTTFEMMVAIFRWQNEED